MRIQTFSILAVLLLPVLSACSSTDSEDRNTYIEKCMYPNAAIKVAVDSENYCACRYDSIREQFGKPFFIVPITDEEDIRRLDFARGFTAGKCAGMK